MADTPVRIVTAGSLGKALGRTEWRLHLSNPSVAEAIRAIDANTGGKLRRLLMEQGNSRFYKVALARKDNLLGKDELTQPSGRGDIYILPTVRGRESGGAKILAAVGLAALVFFSAGTALPAAVGLTKGSFLAVGYGLSASLAMGGIVQLFTPVPNFNQQSEDNRGSDVFQGNATAVAQGAAIPLLYGRAMATPMPISVSFTAFDKSIANSFARQEYDIEYGEGGIVNYVPVTPGVGQGLPS